MSDPQSVSSVQDALSFQTSTTNMIPNPSFEVAGDPFAGNVFQGGGAIVSGWGRTSVYQAWVGSWTYHISVGSSTAAAFTDQAFLAYPVSGVVGGEKYSGSVSFRTNNLNAGARIRIDWFNGATPLGVSENGQVAWASKTSEYRRARINGGVAPLGATNCKVVFITTSNIANQTYEITTDGWQF